MNHVIGFLDGIRIRALAGVMDPDEEYTLRDIFRWYSREFSTPLHEVEGLPLESILINWFEVQYAELEPEEQNALALELIESPDERKAREEADKKSEDAFLQKARERNAKKSSQTLMRKLFEKQLAKAKELELKPKPEEKQEEVVVKYVSTGDMDAELDKPNGPMPGSNRKNR